MPSPPTAESASPLATKGHEKEHGFRSTPRRGYAACMLPSCARTGLGWGAADQDRVTRPWPLTTGWQSLLRDGCSCASPARSRGGVSAEIANREVVDPPEQLLEQGVRCTIEPWPLRRQSEAVPSELVRTTLEAVPGR